MKYALIIDNIVVQVQPNPKDGFINIEDSICCGMIKQGNTFVNPVFEKTEEQIFSEKWETINHYLDNEIPNFINENTGNEFMIKTADLLWIEKESKEWTDEESYSWIQFGIPTFQTNKNELKMAITDAKNKRQNKIAEIFELGA